MRLTLIWYGATLAHIDSDRPRTRICLQVFPGTVKHSSVRVGRLIHTKSISMQALLATMTHRRQGIAGLLWAD